MVKNSKKMTVLPLADRVLIKPEASEGEKTASGIYIPDTASKERPDRGTVIAVGEGKRNDSGQLIPLRVKIGDSVMYAKYSTDEIEIDGEKHVIVPEVSVLAIIK